MKRREFIYHGALAAFTAGAGLNPLSARRALAAVCPGADLPRTLVNVMLQGGADFRFLLTPAPDHPDPRYLELLWDARRALYSADYESYGQMFDNEYLPVTDPRGGPGFGILRQAGWLHGEFEAGRVAIVANAFCSRNRRHDQSILNADAGEPDFDRLDFDRDGWGGRLVEHIGDGAMAVELGSSVSVFSKGSMPGARLDRVVHAENLRDMALAAPDPDTAPGSRRNVLARALHGWYEARGPETAGQMPADWPYHIFFRHRAALQEFGLQLNERIAGCSDLPPELQELSLVDAGFAQQCRNLFDACQLPDVLRQRVMSMNYGGWDTHDDEYAEFAANITDLFGDAGGVATTLPLVRELPYQAAPAEQNLLFHFASDFGRQLRANGTGGTDHGSGNYSLLIGEAVRGGVYGEMFPQRETLADENGQVPLATGGADIRGLTSTEHILAQACEWCEPGSAAAVVPGAAGAEIEEPGLLEGLLAI